MSRFKSRSRWADLLLATTAARAKLGIVPGEIKALLHEFLATPTAPALGPKPRAGVLAAAELNARLALLFRSGQLTPVRRELIRALLLLWHDQLDAAHTIAQGIETSDGSFVHAMMHRREPDYGNAKYWWRRVGEHAAFPEISRRVAALPAATGNPREAELLGRLTADGSWDAGAFVDACEQAAKAATDDRLLREIQRMETEVLLDHLALSRE